MKKLTVTAGLFMDAVAQEPRYSIADFEKILSSYNEVRVVLNGFIINTWGIGLTP